MKDAEKEGEDLSREQAEATAPVCSAPRLLMRD